MTTQLMCRLLVPMLLLLLVSCGSPTAPGTGVQLSETTQTMEATQQVQPTAAVMTPDSILTMSPATATPSPPPLTADEEPTASPPNATSESTPTSSITLPRDELERQALDVAVYQPGDPAACGLPPLPAPPLPAPPDTSATVRVFFACQPTTGPETSAVPAREVIVPPGADPKRIAMQALLAGPTTAEQNAGYSSMFAADYPAISFEITTFDDGLAVVDFDPAILAITQQFNGGSRNIFVANADIIQIVTTLGQFPDVKRVAVLVGGEVWCKAIGEC